MWICLESFWDDYKMMIVVWAHHITQTLYSPHYPYTNTLNTLPLFYKSILQWCLYSLPMFPCSLKLSKELVKHEISKLNSYYHYHYLLISLVLHTPYKSLKASISYEYAMIMLLSSKNVLGLLAVLLIIYLLEASPPESKIQYVVLTYLKLLRSNNNDKEDPTFVAPHSAPMMDVS